jgi:hypothetical protein
MNYGKVNNLINSWTIYQKTRRTQIPHILKILHTQIVDYQLFIIN